MSCKDARYTDDEKTQIMYKYFFLTNYSQDNDVR